MKFFGLLQSAVNLDLPLVTPLSIFISMPVKITVDIVKGAFETLPRKFLPLIGVTVAFLFALVVLVAVKASFDLSIFAQCLLAAVIAQVTAMAATSNQTKVEKVDERINTALNMEKGSKVEDLNKVMEDRANGG